MSLRKKKIILGLLVLSLVSYNVWSLGIDDDKPKSRQENVENLAGKWRFALDPDDKGITKEWFNRNLAGSINLPGTTSENRIGTPETDSYKTLNKKTIYNFREYFSYIGPAWYQRDISIPAKWSHKRVILFLEKTSFVSSVWIDNKKVGDQSGLATGHFYDITDVITPGKVNRLTIRVDNRDKYSVLLNVRKTGSHAYGTETQPRWNGIIGKINLTATDKVWLEKIDIYPDISAQKISIKVQTGNLTGNSRNVMIKVNARSENTGSNHIVPSESFQYVSVKNNQENIFEYSIGSSQLLWDEHIPALYDLDIALSANGFSDKKSVTFGMREFKTDGTSFTINGVKAMMRGTLDCAINPMTGYSPMDTAFYMDIYKRYKDYGINHIRYHSWCPPEAAFIAADRLGLYLEPEGPNMWGTQMASNPANFNFYKAEAIRVVKTYGNHPSFCMYSNSNESKDDINIQSDITSTIRAMDNRHLYTLNTMSTGRIDPHSLLNDFVIENKFRGNISGGGDYTRAVNFFKVPLLHHEIGQWQVFPDVREIPQYTGVLRPFNLEAVWHDMQEKNMENQIGDFVYASGMLSLRLYRAEIESSLRTPDMGGFQMLALQDYPGFGLATDGILTPLYNSKGLITPDEYKKFCGPTVLLTDFPKNYKNYIYKNTQPLKCQVKAAHFTRHGLFNQNVTWSLKDSKNNTIQSGTFKGVTIPIGSGIDIGEINANLSSVTSASQLTLTIALTGTDVFNSWKIWVYPESLPSETSLLNQGNILIASTYTKTVQEHLNKGGNALILPDSVDLANAHPGNYKPVFWSAPLWDKPQIDIQSVGILINKRHHVFHQFPTEVYSDYQWSDLLDNSSSIILDELPEDYLPIVQVIPNGYMNFRRGNLLEAKVGNGKLMICSIDLKNNLNVRHSARQLRHSILFYMAGSNFSPSAELSRRQLAKIFSGNLLEYGKK